MDHDTEFHQMSVHSPCTLTTLSVHYSRTRCIHIPASTTHRIDNVYIAISHALHDSDFGLTRRWLADVGSREGYSQSGHVNERQQLIAESGAEKKKPTAWRSEQQVLGERNLFLN